MRSEIRRKFFPQRSGMPGGVAAVPALEAAPGGPAQSRGVEPAEP